MLLVELHWWDSGNPVYVNPAYVQKVFGSFQKMEGNEICISCVYLGEKHLVNVRESLDDVVRKLMNAG